MVTMADIADHIESHHGDWNAFLTGELQSLCAACHAQKARPFCYDVDDDGWPTDPEHPANRQKWPGGAPG